MLGQKEKNDSNPSTGAINVIGEGSEIKGDLTSNGDLRIDGKIEGNVNTSGKCVLGARGKITGDIKAKNADISGKVDGHIYIQELLLIKSSGVVNGDIKTQRLVLENGSKFNGACTMGSASTKT
jgi:cytoskeletal protein CcmA (bactofilin family)